ncbi:acyl-CoA dehydrogenase family protein [Mycobacterium marseillense]|uniref:Acyl-CoA dehydrogenase n=1 Tax=Mycobacterium marseillense TaxID=701042 RepID=A0AAC9YNG7_9MYCO|nr:acyl-CoA dehydrogenase family protein [Mycobacterium marseillense]ASW92529.1 acyl-CoA dehydrogenase [Mycobacterium marseillense]MCV7406278.1 acyl-CoA dehydrogenase family protein [Mycobacterium marseillense]MDM3975796.1 acyl-CoA dehydrogenase family protein [Mycobacterium marseillense]ORA93701.1 acyl-CoA dehydrogenase [Mycobacterium marseillense]BBY12642.1 acyl-CoA dehydrogenase [Mycobacterium marseillense]
MDFSRVALSPEDQDFHDQFREFLTEHVTDEVRRRDRETGENFSEPVHLALGEAGYLESDWRLESEGGFNPVRRRIFHLEIGRAHAPWFHWGTTAVVARLVRQFGAPELSSQVLPGVLSGEIRLCLGYTEPEGGSDVATCKTRAVRDGDAWIINGSKMFTSNAQNAKYVFLLTNTDPQGPKHKNLTMFLVPLDSEGIEVQAIRTVDGDRTNIVYYSDVRVDDLYRIGEVNGGWTVMRFALDAEHGITEVQDHGLQNISMLSEHGHLMAEAADGVAAILSRPDASGRRPIDDEATKYRLGRAMARIEAAMSTPGMYGRVGLIQTMREVSQELMDLLGAASALPTDTTGSADFADNGAIEFIFRHGVPAGIYGGTMEVFRNMIAQHELGLGRPSYGR